MRALAEATGDHSAKEKLLLAAAQYDSLAQLTEERRLGQIRLDRIREC
jgi:hypothetical protein